MLAHMSMLSKRLRYKPRDCLIPLTLVVCQSCDRRNARICSPELTVRAPTPPVAWSPPEGLQPEG